MAVQMAKEIISLCKHCNGSGKVEVYLNSADKKECWECHGLGYNYDVIHYSEENYGKHDTSRIINI